MMWRRSVTRQSGGAEVSPKLQHRTVRGVGGGGRLVRQSDGLIASWHGED